MKYLGINLAKYMEDLCIENYETMPRGIKTDHVYESD